MLYIIYVYIYIYTCYLVECSFICLIYLGFYMRYILKCIEFVSIKWEEIERGNSFKAMLL